ncbi:unnamed protein product [Prorocentrum cordatum]|uniref:Uncharacterized protein n=1 Tax=Prorocentrum cordatum TaxID=2364126 RepID=A0ABN9QYZ0_9DINO|nr:unnamed protein product [Polarella glacialis]
MELEVPSFHNLSSLTDREGVDPDAAAARERWRASPNISVLLAPFSSGSLPPSSPAVARRAGTQRRPSRSPTEEEEEEEELTLRHPILLQQDAVKMLPLLVGRRPPALQVRATRSPPKKEEEESWRAEPTCV